MDITHKNRKPLWIAGAVLVFLYFAPSAVQSFRQAAFYRQQMQAQNARTQAGRSTDAAPAVVASTAPAVPASADFTRLTGMWQGQQAQSNRDLCEIALEMRENGKGELAGYPKIHCVPLMPYLPGPRKIDPGAVALKSLSPVSAVLSGTPKDGAVAFHIDKTIGATFDGCTLTSFTVTPFGNDQVAAEWRLGTCGKGQMMLRRYAK